MSLAEQAAGNHFRGRERLHLLPEERTFFKPDYWSDLKKEMPKIIKASETKMPDGVSPILFEFALTCLYLGLHKTLDDKKRELLDLYFGTERATNSLTNITGTTDRTVSYHLKRSLSTMRDLLPESFKTYFPAKDVIRLKDRVTHLSSKKQAWAMFGRKDSPETKRRKSLSHLGKRLSMRHSEAISQGLQDHPPYYHASAATREKISHARLGQKASTRRRLDQSIGLKITKSTEKMLLSFAEKQPRRSYSGRFIDSSDTAIWQEVERKPLHFLVTSGGMTIEEVALLKASFTAHRAGHYFIRVPFDLLERVSIIAARLL